MVVCYLSDMLTVWFQRYVLQRNAAISRAERAWCQERPLKLPLSYFNAKLQVCRYCAASFRTTSRWDKRVTVTHHTGLRAIPSPLTTLILWSVSMLRWPVTEPFDRSMICNIDQQKL